MKVVVENKHRIDVSRKGFRNFSFEVYGPNPSSTAPAFTGNAVSYRDAKKQARNFMASTIYSLSESSLSCCSLFLLVKLERYMGIEPILIHRQCIVLPLN